MKEFLEWKQTRSLWVSIEKGLTQKINRYATRIFEMINTKTQLAKEEEFGNND
jgi:hypothetical protein